MKKILCVVLALLMAMGVCQMALAEGDPIKIGGIGPTSGITATYGQGVQKGVQLYISQVNAAGGINGRPVEFIWEDDKGDALESINAYNKLVDRDNVVAIIGPVLSGGALAVAPLAAEINIPVISPSATSYDVTTGRPSVFRSCFLDPFQSRSLANFAHSREMNRVAVIYDNTDDYATGLAENFRDQALANGMEVVAYEAATAADVDFKAQLTNIAAANPDALYSAFYYEPLAMILRQSKEVGLNCSFLGGDGVGGVEELVDDNDLLSRMYYTDHFAADADDEMVKNFIASYVEFYGEMPGTAFNATGYDAAMIVCAAIEAAGSTEYQAIVDQVKATSLDCVTGHITFDDHNDPIKNAYIINYVDGQKVCVDIVKP